eukprot:TRINITY_DN3173_c1_g1_i1.p1 TRINITY_DN3173_c1_g1~~TRINITY_DN3173_c1_g1_i1.p1  ORF type:complete len:1970 (-),score=431.47 TRINITY_DN3173_c1_g1_i1:282-5417(-)
MALLPLTINSVNRYNSNNKKNRRTSNSEKNSPTLGSKGSQSPDDNTTSSSSSSSSSSTTSVNSTLTNVVNNLVKLEDEFIKSTIQPFLIAEFHTKTMDFPLDELFQYWNQSVTSEVHQYLLLPAINYRISTELSNYSSRISSLENEARAALSDVVHFLSDINGKFAYDVLTMFSSSVLSFSDMIVKTSNLKDITNWLKLIVSPILSHFDSPLCAESTNCRIPSFIQSNTTNPEMLIDALGIKQTLLNSRRTFFETCLRTKLPTSTSTFSNVPPSNVNNTDSESTDSPVIISKLPNTSPSPSQSQSQSQPQSQSLSQSDLAPNIPNVSQDYYYPVSPTTFYEAQHLFSTTIKEKVISPLWKVLVSFLPSPPCTVAMLCFGSVSRGDMFPYSDVDWGLLLVPDNITPHTLSSHPPSIRHSSSSTNVKRRTKLSGSSSEEETSSNNSNSNSNSSKSQQNDENINSSLELRSYLTCLCWLLEYFFLSFGEDNAPGFSFDKKMSPSVNGEISWEGGLIGTISDFVKNNFERCYSNEASTLLTDVVCYSLCQAEVVCGSSPVMKELSVIQRKDLNRQLLAQIYKYLEQNTTTNEDIRSIFSSKVFPLPRQLNLHEFMTLGRWSESAHEYYPPSYSRDMKQFELKMVHRPLTIMASTLSFYYKMSYRHPLKIFSHLKQIYGTFLPLSFLTLCEHAWAQIALCRLIAHFHHGCQKEEVSLGIIHEKAWKDLKIIIGNIIYPWKTSISKYLGSFHLFINDNSTPPSIGRMNDPNCSSCDLTIGPTSSGIFSATEFSSLTQAFSESRWGEFISSVSNENDNTMFNIIPDYPHVNGWRYSVETARKKWLRSLRSFVIDKDEFKSLNLSKDLMITIKSPSFGVKYLRPEIIQTLLDGFDHPNVDNSKIPVMQKTTGTFNQNLRKYLPGSHIVFPIVHNGFGIHVKVNPSSPGMTEAVDEFTRLVVGTVSPFTELWEWEYKSNRSLVLVSESISGDTLQSYLTTHHHRHIESHRFANFSEILLASILIEPEDHLFHKIIVSETESPYNHQNNNNSNNNINVNTSTNQEKANNNIHLFYLNKERNTLNPTSQNNNYYYQKNALFCFEQMQDPLDPYVIEKMKAFNPINVLFEWIKLMYKLNQGYYEIFKDRLNSQLFNDEPDIPVYLPDGFCYFKKDSKCASNNDQHNTNQEPLPDTKLYNIVLIPMINYEFFESVYHKITFLQKILSKFQNQNHMELLSRFDAQLSIRYNSTFTHPCLSTRFDAAVNKRFDTAVSLMQSTDETLNDFKQDVSPLTLLFSDQLNSPSMLSIFNSFSTPSIGSTTNQNPTLLSSFLSSSSPSFMSPTPPRSSSEHDKSKDHDRWVNDLHELEVHLNVIKSCLDNVSNKIDKLKKNPFDPSLSTLSPQHFQFITNILDFAKQPNDPKDWQNTFLQSKIFQTRSTSWKNRLKFVNCFPLQDITLKNVLTSSPDLKYLDISGCVALTKKIWKVIADHPRLEVIIAKQLNQLSCSLTIQPTPNHFLPKKVNIQILKLKECMNLKDVNIQLPSLVSIDVSNCVKLKSLVVRAPFLSLVKLDHCSSLDNLSITSNKLPSFSLWRCNISSFIHYSPVVSYSWKDESRVNSSVYYVVRQPSDAKNLIQDMKNIYITGFGVLDLSDSDLNDKHLSILANAITSSSAIHTLDLSGNEFTPEAMQQILSPALETNTSINLFKYCSKKHCNVTQSDPC